MFTRLTSGVISCLLLSSFIGCSQTGLIRGQDPTIAYDSSISTSNASYGVYSDTKYPKPFNNPISKMQKKWIDKKVAASQGYCQDCQPGGQAPHWDGKQWCNCDGTPYYGWAPTHTYQHQYQIPKNLVYPQANTPAGVVVYPYYTLKGPDDFFLN